MIKKRLIILRDALLKFDESNKRKRRKIHFNMRRWATKRPEHLRGVGAPPGCGTACCALGLGATLPELKKLGLSLHFAFDGMAVVRFKGLGYADGYQVAEKFFRIGYEDAEYLFNPHKYTDFACMDSITPKMVADRIDELLNRAEATAHA
jgi:hypothetical protein